MGSGGNVFVPPGSVGSLCVAPGVKRFVSPPNDTSQYPGGFDRVVGTEGVDDPVSRFITPGSTWTFQAWYRDAQAATSNLTDAVTVTFR